MGSGNDAARSVAGEQVRVVPTSCRGGRPRPGHRPGLGRLLSTPSPPAGRPGPAALRRSRPWHPGPRSIRCFSVGNSVIGICCGRSCGGKGTAARPGPRETRLASCRRPRDGRRRSPRGRPDHPQSRPACQRRGTDPRRRLRGPSTQRHTNRLTHDPGHHDRRTPQPQHSHSRPARIPSRRRPGPGPANPRLANRARPLHLSRRTPGGHRRRRQEIRIPQTPCPRLVHPRPTQAPPTHPPPTHPPPTSRRLPRSRRLESGPTCGCLFLQLPAG